VREASIEFYAEALAILRILEHALPRGARILDAGSGRGFLGGFLGLYGYTVIGMDLDCSRSIIECVEHDAERAPWPFPDNSFDAVVSQHMIEHLDPEGQAVAVREMARIARRLIVIVTPNRRFPWKKPDGVHDPEHRSVLDARRLHRLLREACVRPCRVRVAGIQNFAYASARYYPLLHRLAQRILPKPTLLGVAILEA
jgi:SAM-dependent methyltransferase